jgi:hypothetical protein
MLYKFAITIDSLLLYSQTKCIDLMISTHKKRLESMRVHVNDMIHVKVEVKADSTLTGSAGLTVCDWVEIKDDFSPGINSDGGVGIITSIVEKFSHVKYILDCHTKKQFAQAPDVHSYALLTRKGPTANSICSGRTIR